MFYVWLVLERSTLTTNKKIIQCKLFYKRQCSKESSPLCEGIRTLLHISVHFHFLLPLFLLQLTIINVYINVYSGETMWDPCPFFLTKNPITSLLDTLAFPERYWTYPLKDPLGVNRTNKEKLVNFWKIHFA